MRNFLQGMGLINLFPIEQNDCISLPSISNQEALENDWKQVGADMWNAIEKIRQEYPDLN